MYEGNGVGAGGGMKCIFITKMNQEITREETFVYLNAFIVFPYNGKSRNHSLGQKSTSVELHNSRHFLRPG